MSDDTIGHITDMIDENGDTTQDHLEAYGIVVQTPDTYLEMDVIRAIPATVH